MRAHVGKSRYSINNTPREMKAIETVHYGHIEWGCGGALFLESANVEVVMPSAAIGQAVNEPGISVIGADHWRVGGEHGIEFAIRNAVRVLAGRLECHEINHVDHSNLDIWKVPAQQ